MGSLVIAVYRPKPGQEAALEALALEHTPALQAWGLATPRAPILGRARDGSIVEVFEWVSMEAVERAHTDPRVLELWGRFDAVCTYSKLAELSETQDLFAHFEPVA